MKNQDETLQDGLETLERVLGTGSLDKTMPETESEGKDQTPDQPETGQSTDKPPETASPPSSTAKQGAPVFVYLAILFASAFLMLLLAYFIQERNSAAQIGNLQDALENIQSIDEILAENQKMRTDLRSLQNSCAEITRENSSLEQHIAAISRANDSRQRTKDVLFNIILLENLMREERYEEAAVIYTTLLRKQELSFILDEQTTSAENAHFSIRDRLLEIGIQLEEQGYPLQVEQYRLLIEETAPDPLEP